MVRSPPLIGCVEVPGLVFTRNWPRFHRRYSLAARDYVTRENIADSSAEIVKAHPEKVRSVLAPHVIFIDVPIPPDAYSRLRECLQNLDFTTTLHVDVSAPRDSSDEPSNTRFYSAMGAVDEPRALIRNIVADARDGTRFGEMAVFYPTPDYSSRIKDALDDAGIKNCGPSPRTLAETAAGKFVSLFFNMLAEDMRRDMFTSWTSSSPVRDPVADARVPAVPWEVVSRNARISRFSGEIDWAASLEKYARLMRRRAQRAAESDDQDGATVDPDSLHETADNALKLRDFVKELTARASVEHPTCWGDWVGWLEEITSDYLVASDKTDDEDRTGIKRIRDAFDQVRGLDAVTRSEVDLSKFTRTVQRLLGTTTGTSSGWGSSVLVAPLTAGVGNAFKSIHILGMSEGSLPGPGRTDPLFPDALRREIDPEGERLLTGSDHLDINHATFLMATSCAPNSRLYWNKALMGATNESYPSPWFVDEIQKASNQTNIPVKSLMDPNSEYVESVAALSEIAQTTSRASSGYDFGLRDVAVRSQLSSPEIGVLHDPVVRGVEGWTRRCAISSQ